MFFSPDNIFLAFSLFIYDLNMKHKNITFVSPAMGATLQTFLDRSVLMIELFPTLG